jgi:hypothetical protein
LAEDPSGIQRGKLAEWLVPGSTGFGYEKEIDNSAKLPRHKFFIF